MARLKGPLFSQKAQKQLGKTLIYKTKLNRSFLTKYNKPGSSAPFKVSEKQQLMRQVYACGVTKWQALSIGAKKAWDDLVIRKKLKMSGWNYFYKLIIPACAIEVCDYPVENDVVKDVEFGNGEYKGNSDKGLPWTGQISTYAYRDDGAYKKGHTTDRPIVKGIGSHRFTDNGDGTITDKATGLMWVKDPINGVGSPFDIPISWAYGLLTCEVLTFAGHSDWRMPNIKELMSIVDYNKTPGPIIDETYFACERDEYHSSTTAAWFTDGAIGIEFEYGFIQGISKVNNAYVRPVRLGLP